MNFEEALEELIDKFLTYPDTDVDQIISALELKLYALRKQADEDTKED